MPIVVLVSGLVTFVAIGVAGASVIERYLAVPALALMVLAAVAIGGWTMLLPGWVRTVWMVGAIALVVFGVGFTATRLNLARFDNELRFRGQAHQDLSEVLSDPQVKAGLRCGPLTGPNHKIVPDARWIAGTAEGTVLAREWVDRIERQQRDADAGKTNSKGERIKHPDPEDLARAKASHERRRRDRGHEPLRDLQARVERPGRQPAHPGPARRASSASRRRGSTPPMSAARRSDAAAGFAGAKRDRGAIASRIARARWAWPAALLGLFVAALILRLVGFKTGLPYVYNADENAHFVPRAIGMFGHGWNPGYFINPPAFTYVLHVLFAIRWGTDPASVGGAFAANPTEAFAIARAASGFLGALAVPLTAIAGARLFEDKRVGFIAGALLAVAFLPVHYGHFALNDAPTMAPLALSLVGVAGIYRTGRMREYVIAGVGLGLAIATKYQAGIVVVTIVAAAFASPVVHNRLKGLAFAFAPMLLAFLVANPYALLDRAQFIDDLRKQTSTAAGNEGGGKLGPGPDARPRRTTCRRSHGASAGCLRCSPWAGSAG